MDTYICINDNFDLAFTITSTFDIAFERLKVWTGYDVPDLRYMSPIMPDENPVVVYLKNRPTYYIYRIDIP